MDRRPEFAITLLVEFTQRTNHLSTYSSFECPNPGQLFRSRCQLWCTRSARLRTATDVPVCACSAGVRRPSVTSRLVLNGRPVPGCEVTLRNRPTSQRQTTSFCRLYDRYTYQTNITRNIHRKLGIQRRRQAEFRQWGKNHPTVKYNISELCVSERCMVVLRKFCTL